MLQYVRFIVMRNIYINNEQICVPKKILKKKMT